MGLCGDFVCRIGGSNCSGRMAVRDEKSCSCPECGVVCTGRFLGCPSVWANGSAPSPFADDSDGSSLFANEPEPWLSPLTEPVGVAAATAFAAADGQQAGTLPSDGDRRIEALAQAVNEHTATLARLVKAVERLEAAVVMLHTTPDDHEPGVDLRSLFGHSAVLLESHAVMVGNGEHRPGNEH